jgi:hypothetical protein
VSGYGVSGYGVLGYGVLGYCVLGYGDICNVSVSGGTWGLWLGLVGVVGKNGVAVFTLSAISNSIIIKPY